MDQIAAYELHPDPVHYTTKFLDGLKPGVRLLVAIQQPGDLETAYSLALLYEELGDDYKAVPPPIRHSVLPPPQPPPPPSSWFPKPAEERKSLDSSRSAGDDKWHSLKNYRHSKGLCFICGEKWNKEHHWKNSIQLHVVQEMVQYMQNLEDHSYTEQADQTMEPSPQIMMLSLVALNPDLPIAKAMQPQVEIQGQ
jgi:hypothetical protein